MEVELSQPGCTAQLTRHRVPVITTSAGNRLSQWTLPNGSFPVLRVLKAAGCSLQTQCLHHLAALPSLTELHLSNNQIAQVPEEMADDRAFPLLQVSSTPGIGWTFMTLAPAASLSEHHYQQHHRQYPYTPAAMSVCYHSQPGLMQLYCCVTAAPALRV